MLGGNLSPDFSAILKLAGVEGGLENNIFRGKARVFEGEQGLLEALDKAPERFQNNDMIIVRYEGPSGAPGMPEMLDPTSRITTLCRERGIVVGADDGRALLRRLGRPRHRPRRPGGRARRPDRVHRGRRRDRGRPQQERAQLHRRSPIPPPCKKRKAAWEKVVAANGGIHPNCGDGRHAPAAPRPP